MFQSKFKKIDSFIQTLGRTTQLVSNAIRISSLGIFFSWAVKTHYAKFRRLEAITRKKPSSRKKHHKFFWHALKVFSSFGNLVVS